MSRFDLTYNVFQILHAFYWVMVDILGTLKDAAGKVNGGVKLHLILASKRVNLIVEQLMIALEQAGIKIDERMSEEEIRKRIGALSLETLESIRETLKRLIDELAAPGERNASWVSNKLKEIADVICIASGLLKAYSNSLKESQDESVWRTCLILQTVAQDLEVIVNANRYLASNPEMLARDLKLNL
ncbi:MAG: hypothetical protein QXK89_09525 [Candidatus Bathyarchaeia archaeon]